MKKPFEDLVGKIVLAGFRESRDSAFFGRLSGFDDTHVVLDDSVEIVFDTRSVIHRKKVESNNLSVYEELRRLNPNAVVYKLARKRTISDAHLPRAGLILEPYKFDNSLFGYFSGEDAEVLRRIEKVG